jgi:hypothetical protein
VIPPSGPPDNSQIPADLAEVVAALPALPEAVLAGILKAAWPTLPEPVRAGILAMVKASSTAPGNA